MPDMNSSYSCRCQIDGLNTFNEHRVMPCSFDYRFLKNFHVSWLSEHCEIHNVFMRYPPKI